MFKKFLKNRWVLVIIGICIFFAISSYSWLKEFNHYVELTDQSSKAVQVSAEIVRSGQIAQWVLSEGTTTVTKRRCLNFEVPGHIQKLGVDSSGVTIHEGAKVIGPPESKTKPQLLAQLEDRKYYQQLMEAKANYTHSKKSLISAQAELKQSQSNYRLRKNLFARNGKLFEKRLLEQNRYDQSRVEFEVAEANVSASKARIDKVKAAIDAAEARYELAKIAYGKTRLYAPWSGVIARLNIKEGQYTTAVTETGSNACAISIIDPTSFEIKLQLPVHEGVLVKKGNTALIKSNQRSTPQKKNKTSHVPAVVYSVSPTLTSGIHAIQVTVRTSSSQPDFKSGELVSVRIKTTEHDRSLLIPQRALLYQQNSPYLFVVNQASSTAEKRSVELGIQEGNTFEVLNGLKLDESVITDGRFRLTHGSQIEIVKYRE